MQNLNTETSVSKATKDNFNKELILKKVIAVLEQIYDPEIPINIYRLGLIYNIELFIKDDNVFCNIEMTLTSAACPVAESLVQQVYNVVYVVDEVDAMNVDLVFEPPWTSDKIPYEAKLELGLL